MHACEAALWAYEATGQKDPYLRRAKTLANSVAKRLVGLTMTESNVLSNETPFSSKVAGFIWEHYDTEWNIDYDYNKARFISDNISNVSFLEPKKYDKKKLVFNCFG